MLKTNYGIHMKLIHLIRGFLLVIVPFVVFSLTLIPTLLVVKLLWSYWSFSWLQVLALPFILYILGLVLITSVLLISGVFMKFFHIQYKPGTHRYSLDDPNAFRWILFCVLYTPCRKMLEAVLIGRLKYWYYGLVGMKIGNNTLVGGVVKDPCVTEFGDNVTIGEYAIIYGHIHNFQKRSLFVDKVIVGNNCVIGAGAVIMPGVTMENDVVVAAGAVVPKKQVLKMGKMYGGVPAVEISVKETKKRN